MSKEDRLRRFFEHSKDTNEWEKDYAKLVAFVERQGIIVTEEYPHLKLMNQMKYFNEYRKEDFEMIGKMIGCIK